MTLDTIFPEKIQYIPEFLIKNFRNHEHRLFKLVSNNDGFYKVIETNPKKVFLMQTPHKYYINIIDGLIPLETILSLSLSSLLQNLHDNEIETAKDYQISNSRYVRTLIWLITNIYIRNPKRIREAVTEYPTDSTILLQTLGKILGYNKMFGLGLLIPYNVLSTQFHKDYESFIREWHIHGFHEFKYVDCMNYGYNLEIFIAPSDSPGFILSEDPVKYDNRAIEIWEMPISKHYFVRLQCGTSRKPLDPARRSSKIKVKTIPTEQVTEINYNQMTGSKCTIIPYENLSRIL